MSILSSLKKTAKAVAADQSKRLKNVAAVLSIAVNPFTKDKIKANTGIKPVDKVLGAAASHPYITAAPIAVVKAPAAAAVIAKAVGQKALTTAAAHPVKTAGVLAGAVVVGSAVKQNPKLASVVRNPLPELAETGSDIGKFTKNPSLETAADIAKNSPLITAGTALVAGAVIGKSATIGAANLANTLATTSNTRAIKDSGSLPSTSTTTSSPMAASPLSSSAGVSPSPVLPQTQSLSTVRTTGVARRRKQKPQSQSQRQSMRVQIINAKYIRGFSH